ncbi:MAG: DUF167 domain-containing protein [Limnothrix sp. RL_2_0]|nr:DUF167 domain-containing protein [Limnothrix sp. RL_2_0]
MRIRVIVKPKAKEQHLSMAADGSLVVWLRSPSVDGKANTELIKLFAQYYRGGDRRSLAPMTRQHGKHCQISI